jgi:hypothetical protein
LWNGFLGVHSDEDQRYVNIYNGISDFVDYTTWRISVWLVLVSERCTQIIACFAFSAKFCLNLTSVPLRRSLSKVPCIRLVFSSTFMMSISVN